MSSLQKHFLSQETLTEETKTTVLDPQVAGLVADKLNHLLANVFTLYIKTKNFHWHVSGPQFTSYHELFDKDAQELIAVTDVLAERARMLGSNTLKSLRQIDQIKSLPESEDDLVAKGMIESLLIDNQALIPELTDLRTYAESNGDTATSALVDSWLDQTSKRIWFLKETLK